MDYPLFPLFVPLAGKTAVLVGGGGIAARRVEKLLLFGARVVVVSPALHPALQKQAENGKIHWEARFYREGDLADAALAVAATDVRAVNHAVAEEAHARQVPVSVADRRAESTFYFPAIARGGGLVAGMVSENGEAHRAVRETAQKIREVLDGNKDSSGGQPGKPACGGAGADRDRRRSPG